jgi:hypothetical protein
MRTASSPIAGFISLCAAEENAIMNTAKILAAACFVAALSAPAIAAAPPSATAVVGSDGSLIRGIAVTGASHVSTGVYTVTFSNSDLPTACAYTASVGSPTAGVNETPSLVNVGAAGTAGTISVRTYVWPSTPADLPFEVYVAC